MQLSNSIKKNKKIILAILFGVHFFWVIAYNLKSTINIAIKQPAVINHFISNKKLQAADYVLSKVLSSKTTPNNYQHLYLDLTGAQTYFDYFVTGDTAVEKMFFEIELKDGSRHVVLPTVGSNEMNLHMQCLLNTIRTTKDENYRNLLVQRLTEHQLINYTAIKSVTTVFGIVKIPAYKNYTKENTTDFSYLYKYHFVVN